MNQPIQSLRDSVELARQAFRDARRALNMANPVLFNRYGVRLHADGTLLYPVGMSSQTARDLIAHDLDRMYQHQQVIESRAARLAGQSQSMVNRQYKIERALNASMRI